MKTEELLNELDKRLTTHEAICAERWSETISKIKRLETILIGCFGSIVLILITIILKGYGGKKMMAKKPMKKPAKRKA